MLMGLLHHLMLRLISGKGNSNAVEKMKPGLVRPLDATDEEICKKVRDQINSDRRTEVEETAQALDISYSSVSTILYDRLGMRKLTACWIPKSLSDEQRATRAPECSALLKRFRSKKDFLLNLVTVDETWVH